LLAPARAGALGMAARGPLLELGAARRVPMALPRRVSPATSPSRLAKARIPLSSPSLEPSRGTGEERLPTRSPCLLNVLYRSVLQLRRGCAVKVIVAASGWPARMEGVGGDRGGCEGSLCGPGDSALCGSALRGLQPPGARWLAHSPGVSRAEMESAQNCRVRVGRISPAGTRGERRI
jgi:hypothetical protein